MLVATVDKLYDVSCTLSKRLGPSSDPDGTEAGHCPDKRILNLKNASSTPLAGSGREAEKKPSPCVASPKWRALTIPTSTQDILNPTAFYVPRYRQNDPSSYADRSAPR